MLLKRRAGWNGSLENTNKGSKLLWRGLKWRTLPSLLNQGREVISDSIIIFSGGNSEQMVTIVTGLTAISTAHGHLFFGTNLPWPHEVFIVVLAPGGEACQQVNSIRDTTASEYFMWTPFDSLYHFHKTWLCLLEFCQFDSSEWKWFFFVVLQEIYLMSSYFFYCISLLSNYWHGWTTITTTN